MKRSPDQGFFPRTDTVFVGGPLQPDQTVGEKEGTPGWLILLPLVKNTTIVG